MTVGPAWLAGARRTSTTMVMAATTRVAMAREDMTENVCSAASTEDQVRDFANGIPHLVETPTAQPVDIAVVLPRPHTFARAARRASTQSGWRATGRGARVGRPSG